MILPCAVLSKVFPALSTEKYADFIEANRSEDSVERLKELKKLVSEKSNMRTVHLNSITFSQTTKPKTLLLFFFFFSILADTRIT